MSISAQDVKSLREKTGAGMLDCKKALQEAEGNMDSAIEFLKKQGLAKAVKKGDRIAAEGLVFAAGDANQAALVEINCETDFVAKNDDFLALGAKLAEVIKANDPADLEAALALDIDGKSALDYINEKIAVIGENIRLRRFQVLKASDAAQIITYNHNNGKIFVAIEIAGDNVNADWGRDVCMQIAAMAPQYLDKSEVPASVIEAEKEIRKVQLLESGKPENMLDKILAGQLDKFAGEMSLLQQVYVKDMGGKKKVADYIKECDPTAKVNRFVRFAVGEGIEKRQEDFAEEVAKMAQ